MSGLPRPVRSSFGLLLVGATAAALTMAPLDTALAKKEASPVRHIAYQQWDSAADFGSGRFSGTQVVGDDLALGTDTSTTTYTDPVGGATATYDVGTWTSPVIATGFPYTELVASWNADTPAGTWVQVSMHGKADDGTTSKEYVLGRWAENTDTIHRTSVPTQGDTLATIAIDTLIARKGRTLSDWQLTLSLYRKVSTTTAPSPTVSLVGAMASALPAAKKVTASPLGGAEGVELNVPTYSQEIHRGHYPEYNNGGEAWCSPTSTAMVLGYWQQSNPANGPSVAEYGGYIPPDPWVDYAAASTYDWNYDGTGNWPFNTAYAGRYGLDSFVTRLRSLNEAETFISAGIPLVVSVSFKESELTGAGYSTDGHLMVIRGFTANGDVIANDPASHLLQSDTAVRTVYNRAQFENVWIPKSGGIAYVIHPASVQLPANVSSEHNW